MPDNLDWQFKHGLDEPFLSKLKELAEKPGWFADVLADPDLIIGIRNNYMNVYWRGQSLFKIDWNGTANPLKVSTHPKYLIDPDLAEAVELRGEAFEVQGHKALTTKYDGPTTLKNMKRAAKLYCGEEKKGVHALIRANPDVIDTEVTFHNKKREDEKERLLPRIDIACFEEEDREIRLHFWEAKLYENGEIRAEGDTEPPVLAQVRGYRKLVEKHGGEIIDSYRKVARNLVEIAGWPGSDRKVGGLVKQVADGRSFSIGNPRSVGLVIYKFDNAQKNSPRWTKEMAKLERETLMPLCRVGDPTGFKLRSS